MISFSVADYIAKRKSGFFQYPFANAPYFATGPSRMYFDLTPDLWESFDELRKRLPNKHYSLVLSTQLQALYWSSLAFPAYRKLLPEVICDDWLATVDWHSFHRDHIVHQPLTCYITRKLLDEGGDTTDCCKINDRPLLEYAMDAVGHLLENPRSYLSFYLEQFGVSSQWRTEFKNPVYQELWKGLFIEAASLASLFHDIGYPWQFFSRLQHQLPESLKYITNKISDLSWVRDRLLTSPFRGYAIPKDTPATWKESGEANLINSALLDTHGFPGAMSFLSLNETAWEQPFQHIDPIRRFCIEWAAMAIGMHDLGKIYWPKTNRAKPVNRGLRLEFSTDPLSSVITLADVLQDFGRPTAKFEEFPIPRESVSYSLEDGTSETEMSVTGNTLDITYVFTNKIKQSMKEIYGLDDDCRIYFDPQYGFLNLSSLGIAKTNLTTRLRNK